MPAETTCLGRKPPYTCLQLADRLPQRATANLIIGVMMQEPQHEVNILVGLDAHSERASLCITEWRHGTDPVVKKQFDTCLSSLEKTYKKQVPKNAITVLESSTNAFSIHKRLHKIGYNAKILISDTLSGRSRADKVNDRSDARNLTIAYARGGTREVHVPTEYYQHLRDLFYGYNSAVTDTTRYSNRLWAFCSEHGLKLPKRTFTSKTETIKEELQAKNWSEEELLHLEIMTENYKHASEQKKRYRRLIVKTVAHDKQMKQLMQILGVRYIVAFALVAFIEKVERFPTHKKLVAYIGLNPMLNESGKSKGSNRLSRFGRQDLKTLMVLAAQAAMRTGNTSETIWARRKAATGKPYNLVIVALARKMVTQVWHIMMGHPPLNREEEESFYNKLIKLGRELGKENLKMLGYATTTQFADEQCKNNYAHLPDKEIPKPA